jgi:threonine dehydratase
MDSSAETRPSRAGIEQAADVLRGVAAETPLLLVEAGPIRFRLKPESLQPIGAFKLRGAYHRLAAMSAAERRAGVVAFSSGNHAQGIAWAARRLGIAATIVMPADAPRAKLAATEALGATIRLYDRATESREAIAADLAGARGCVLVPSFDDPWVVEGQGTVGLEAARQMAAMGAGPIERVVVCCGGGGFSAGIALALPGAEIVVVEPEGWADMGRSLAAGRIEPVGPNPPPTSCDALQTLRVADLTFGILHRAGAHGVAVSEAEARRAMRFAFERLRLVAEPGGAVALAAVLAGRVPADERTVVVLSGGNVDPGEYAAVLAEAG